MKALRALAVLACAVGITSTASAQLIIVDDLPGEFIDISQTGLPLDLGNDASIEIITAIGNTIFPSGSVIVGNNGGLGFDPVDPTLPPENEAIPTNNGFGGSQSAFIFWDDIGNDIGFGDLFTGNVFWEEQGGTLIVQWHDRGFDDGKGPDTSRFQIQIFDTPGGPNPIFAQFLYDDIEQPRPGGGASATIGYQDGNAGFNDFQWSFNTPGAVQNGTVLSIMLPEPTSFALLAVAGMMARRRR